QAGHCRAHRCRLLPAAGVPRPRRAAELRLDWSASECRSPGSAAALVLQHQLDGTDWPGCPELAPPGNMAQPFGADALGRMDGIMVMVQVASALCATRRVLSAAAQLRRARPVHLRHCGEASGCVQRCADRAAGRWTAD